MTAAIHADTGELVEVSAVHPVADLFPRLAGEEFDDLVADVRERGLVVPLLLAPDGTLLDGRNRMAACEVADVKPTCTTFYGDDPVGMILALNASRRHLTASQRAMIVAEARALGSPGTTMRSAAAAGGASHPQVVKAAAVIEHAPELVADVKSGTRPLNDAYAVAKARKAEQRSRDEQDRLNAQRLERLRDAYPDLAERVDDGEYSLPAAEGEAKARIDAERSAREAAKRNLTTVLIHTVSKSVAPDVLAKQEYAAVLDDFDAADVRFAANTLAYLAAMKEAKA